MRFEVKTGGAILIVIGLAGLSLIVFALGLFAGYDMARNTAPETPPADSVYPLPNPPPAPDLNKVPSKLSNETAPTQSAAAKPVANVKGSGGADSSAASLSMDKNAGPVASLPRTVANAAASVPPPKMASPDAGPEEKPRVTKSAVTDPPAKYAAATDSSGARHKPVNITIHTLMDRSNAEQMTARLQKLGYRAYMVHTDISGQTWWRVRIGPYQSKEEATAADKELHEKYKDSYVP